MLIKNGLAFVDGTFVATDIAVRDGHIAELAPGASAVSDGDVLDADGCYVIPGLVDVHFHGAMGFDLCDGTQEAIGAIAGFEASRGVTTICPATMTYPEVKLSDVMEGVSAYRSGGAHDGESVLAGVNMEGPYISPGKIGAQNPDYVRAPSFAEFERLQEISGDAIRIVDVAPETEGAIEFIRAVANTGVQVSVAHTCADYEQAVAAFDAGAKQVTHLFNAMPGISHRAPGPIIAAAEADNVTCELICDGVHIHPAVIRFAFKLFGPEHIALISDSMRATGLDDGTYDLGGQQVAVKGNEAKLASGTIAGSVTDLMGCLQFCVKEAKVPIEDAVLAATMTPAKAIGVDGECGSIAIGKRADLAILDKDLNLKSVILQGEAI